MDQNEALKEQTTRKLLDSISPSFCTVKWKHATMNLGSGAVKSCCHLPFRKVELSNTDNDLELHDTAEDRLERAMMMKGEKPKDCAYCWWIEDQGHASDRISWSSKSWMAPYTQAIAEQGTPEAKTPSWVELNFSNTCNLKCSYCSPIFSSKWQQEIRDQGPIPTLPPHNDLHHLQGVELNEKFDNTELMASFWPWFEKCYPDIRLLKITGGEPFLSPHTFKLLQLVLQKPNLKMNLSINSNLSVPNSVWQQFMELCIQLQKTRAVEKFYLHPSIDTFGKRAEYIRFGLDFEVFQKNVEDYLERSRGNLVFICTINNLSLAGLLDFWKYLLDLKKKYGPRGQWVSVTSEVLIGPDWQNINILPEHFQKHLLHTIDYVDAHIGDGLAAFSTYERQGLLRALDLMKIPNKNLVSAKQNFYRFFSEHDRRRGTNLLLTFPEMADFWNDCKLLAMPLL
jgi:organic radical activating enzyme